jgi:fatty acid desaturase
MSRQAGGDLTLSENIAKLPRMDVDLRARKFCLMVAVLFAALVFFTIVAPSPVSVLFYFGALVCMPVALFFSSAWDGVLNRISKTRARLSGLSLSEILSRLLAFLSFVFELIVKSTTFTKSDTSPVRFRLLLDCSSLLLRAPPLSI